MYYIQVKNSRKDQYKEWKSYKYLIVAEKSFYKLADKKPECCWRLVYPTGAVFAEWMGSN